MRGRSCGTPSALPAIKTSVADALAQERRFPVKAITDALGVSRSNLYAKRGSTPRRRYRKDEDDALMSLIREIADARPTYGYPRITSLLIPRETGWRKASWLWCEVKHFPQSFFLGQPIKYQGQFYSDNQ